VVEETEGFNFVTSITSDTFWSQAELFHLPYQPLVWIALGATLFTTGCLLAAVGKFGELKQSSRYFVQILFQFIEVGIETRNIKRHKTPLKSLFGTWLLMADTLTNSYKRLLIPILSVPWELEQDYNYFRELRGFLFYSPVRPFDQASYWDFCAGGASIYASRNESCNYELLYSSAFTSLHQEMADGREKIRSMPGIIYRQRVRVFPRNESKEIYFRMSNNSEKVVIAGLNTEIDEIMRELKTDYPEIMVFRGKDNL